MRLWPCVFLMGCVTNGGVVGTTNPYGHMFDAPTSASSNVASTAVVAASALLLGVGGGISTTVFVGQSRVRARARRAERSLKAAPATREPDSPPKETTPPSPPPVDGDQTLNAPLPADDPSMEALVLARDWLIANQLQLEEDLALGAGPALEDLAGIAGIAPGHRAHFWRLLQRNRARLLTPRELTARQAGDVMAAVGELIMSDDLLSPGAEAMVAAW